MKRIVLLLVVLVLLAGLAWWLNEKSERSTIPVELIDFGISDTASVQRIFIGKSDGSKVDLKRSGNGWLVNDTHKARKTNVDLLLKCFKRIEIRGPVPKTTQQMVKRNMASKAVKVEIYSDADAEPDKIWFIGSSTPDHFGTYMVLEKPGTGRSDVPFEMGMSGFTGYLTPRFHTDVSEWRDSQLIGITDLSAIASYEVVHHDQPEQSFTINALGDDRFELLDVDGHTVNNPDTAELTATLIPLKKLHYEFIVEDMAQDRTDSILTSSPMHEVSILFNDGSSQQVSYWHRKPPVAHFDDDGSELPVDPDRMFSVINDTELVVVQRHLFDRSLPYLSQLK
jgi:hypothetical protein